MVKVNKIFFKSKFLLSCIFSYSDIVAARDFVIAEENCIRSLQVSLLSESLWDITDRLLSCQEG